MCLLGVSVVSHSVSFCPYVCLCSVVLCLPIADHLSPSPPLLLRSVPSSSLGLCEGGQILGARTPGLPGEGPSFLGVTAKPRILSTSHFSPASSVLGLGKGKWRDLSPDFSMPGQGAPQPQPVPGLGLRQQHPD